jgi:hypothetical protein
MREDLPHFAAIIDSYSIPELKLALLRAIDHAHKCSAEISEYKAQLDGAIGTIHGLQEENESLKVRLRESSLPRR